MRAWRANARSTRSNAACPRPRTTVVAMAAPPIHSTTASTWRARATARSVTLPGAAASHHAQKRERDPGGQAPLELQGDGERVATTRIVGERERGVLDRHTAAGAQHARGGLHCLAQ